MKFRIISLILSLCLLLPLLTGRPVQAAEKQAEEISSPDLVTAKENMGGPWWLFDTYWKNSEVMQPYASLTLSSEKGIGSLYFIFVVESGAYKIVNEDTGEEAICGREHFLHDFVDLTELFGEAPQSVTIRFDEIPPRLSELRVFTEGEPPADVQRWKQAPQDGVDLLLFSTHGDDEQLFFAGVLPYYAGELGYEVQVAYLTRHANYGTVRPHEMLDGLWAVGVTNYPVFGDFEDYYCKNLEQAHYAFESRGITEDDILSYVVEQVRRFKPLVVLGHDQNGEYGHGMHMLYSEMVRKAVEVSMDPQQFPETAEKYGVWDVPKTYLHLYPEGAIRMNWDIPLERFDGMTAYQVTKNYGYPAHKSQYDGFAWYMAGYDRAEDIPAISPCDFGLYRTTVGPDVEKNDFFENLTNRAEQKRLEEEEQKRREETEKKKAEEEAARKQQEQAAAQAEKEQADRQKAEIEEARHQAELAAERVQRNQVTLVIAVIVLILLVVCLVWLINRRRSAE